MKYSSICTSSFITAICFALAITVAAPANGQTREDNTVRQASGVFNEIMAVPAKSIPRNMLNDAYGVAIIPGVIKGSFIVGVRHGKGVVLVRDDNGGWHAPMFVSLTGGNIGWQVGVQSTDVILVFKTKKSINGLLTGKFTLGVDAAAAAGPVGRMASAGTDARLAAEIYSYSRSRGLFAGVSLDGSAIQVDQIANSIYYRSPAPGAPIAVPPSAEQLVLKVASYAGTIPTGPQVQNPPNQLPLAQAQPLLVQQHSVDEATHARDELAKFAPQLYELLDQNWQGFLAMPAEVFQGRGHPSIATLNDALTRFETVNNDARYQALADRPEFQATQGLLKHYIQALSQTDPKLNLPAPPAPRIGSR